MSEQTLMMRRGLGWRYRSALFVAVLRKETGAGVAEMRPLLLLGAYRFS
jgi:hypothetical protein